MDRILIVEDDVNLANAVAGILITRDYEPEIAHDGITGLNMAKQGIYDAILLDLMLPGMDGLDVCRDLKSSGVTTPIIMVTAKATIPDKIDGFDAGADDYLPKPFPPDELIARMKAVIRRSMGVVPSSKTRYGNLEFDSETGEIRTAEDTVVLSEKERLMMAELIKDPNKVCSKEQLLHAVWEDASDDDANNVEAYISFLRKKLDFVGSNVKIKTLRKLGYKLDLP